MLNDQSSQHPDDGDHEADVIDLTVFPVAPSSRWPRRGPKVDFDNASATDPRTADFALRGIPRLLEKHAPEVNRRRNAAAALTGKVLKLRGTVEDRVNEQNHKVGERSKARAKYASVEADPNGAVRHVRTGPLVVVLVLGALLQFAIDRLQLQSVFTLYSVGTVSSIAFFLGLVQAVSAHKAGEYYQHEHDADASLASRGERETSHRVATWSAYFGLGSIALLALYRIFRGSFVLAMIFGLGSAAIWLAMAALSYGWASRHASRLTRTTKEHRQASAAAGCAREELAKATGAHATAVAELRSAADKAVAHIDAEVLTLNQRLRADGLPYYVPELPAQYDEWSDLRDLSQPLPADIDLPDWSPPVSLDGSDIDGVGRVNSNNPQATTEPLRPFELGPGR